ncbi:MAG: OmpA family protein [Hyphomicrobiaceae bacterium]
MPGARLMARIAAACAPFVIGATVGVSTVHSQENADVLPAWRIVNICKNDSAAGQCKLYEAVARQRVLSSWTVIPPEWREACLLSFKPPLEPSWRILADCIDDQARLARETRARNLAAASRAEAKRLKDTQEAARLATIAAEEEAERKAAEAKRKADEEEAARKAAEAAEAKRKKDEEEAAREAAEANRKAEAEETARKTAEAAQKAAETKRKKEEEAAEAKRKAEAEEAARKAKEAAESARKAAEAKRKKEEEEAARKAAEATEAQRKADEEVAARKAAEAAEAKRKKEEEEAAISAAARACRTKVRAIADRDPFNFKTRSARVRRYARAQLDEIIAVAQSCPDIKFRVDGHTDSTGDADANQQLSEMRAQAIVDYLISGGVNANRIRAAGFGESEPIATNATSRGRAENRRIEFNVE